MQINNALLKNRINKIIKERGLLYLLPFALRKLPKFIAVTLVYALLRLLRPVIFIRFGSLYANKIGPLISLPGLYLCEKKHNIQPKNTLDIFHDGYGQNRHISNRQLLRMWKRAFSDRPRVLLADGIAKTFFDFAAKFLSGSEHIIRTRKYGRDVLGLIETSDIYLKFAEEEVSRAESEMKKMGIASGNLYVCMLNRDQAYLNETFPGQKWDYQSFRNCGIDNYMPAAEELTKRGYYVIRMGAIVGSLMKTDNPRIIEYSHKGFRTELLDIYLAANCCFFIGCNSGFDAVPWFFRRPEVYVNISDLEYAHSWLSNCLMIFKKYWLKNEKRFMTVRETVASGAGRFQYVHEYEKNGIELIENTPEEILDVVDEMDKRLKGTWQEDKAAEDLQVRFWAYFKSSDLHGVIRSRIGAKFLRQNEELL